MAVNGSTQRAGTLPYDDFPALAEPTAVQLNREYVAGGSWYVYGNRTARALPWSIDDITSDFGDDIYERMLVDPQVAAVIAIFKASILENGPEITSAIPDKKDIYYDDGKEIADQSYAMLANLETSIDDVLWDLLDSIPFGNKVAEKVYDYGAAEKDGRTIELITKIKVKPRHSTIFVVDAYMNLIGLLARPPGSPSPLIGLSTIVPEQLPENLISPEKVAISTFRPHDSDPRGRSLLRAAYDPWWRKRQVIQEYLKYLAQFAGPSLWGTTPERAEAKPDPLNPAAVISPQQILLAALQEFRNGTAAAFPFGTEVHEIAMQGEGAAFLKALDNSDQQITKATLTQELATEEGKHMARAAAQVHQDVLGILIRAGKKSASSVIRRQILKPWVRYVWGDEQARRLLPNASFGEAAQQDRPALMQGIAALANAKYLDASQLRGTDEQLNLPPRDDTQAFEALQRASVVRGGSSVAESGQPPSQPEQQPAEGDQQTTPADNRVKVREHTRGPRRGRDEQQQQEGSSNG